MKIKLRIVTCVLILMPINTLTTQVASSAVTTTALPLSSAVANETTKRAGNDVSVLERFRVYTGPRTPETLSALFSSPLQVDTQQQPEVALSDGATIITITLTDGTLGSNAPNIAFKGAQLISLKRSRTADWEIDALPDAGVLNPTMFIVTGSGTREIPLTITPALPAGTDLSKKGFAAFLGGLKGSSQMLLDLNNDGHIDYLDDYIFTANYLVRLKYPSDGPLAAQPIENQNPTFAQPSDLVSQAAITDSGAESTTNSQSPAVQGISNEQTPYQRNIINRNQRARELTERLRGNAPSLVAPTAVPPAK